ncbi:MAG: PD-(D/E)XK nuclease-like domain-containing protein [Planctomycetota bacterium]
MQRERTDLPAVKVGSGSYAQTWPPANALKKRKPVSLDFLIEESMEQYHEARSEHLTSHQLADFRACPLLARWKQIGMMAQPDSDAYRFGRAVHVRVLEGIERFDEDFEVGGPINEKTGRPYGTETKAFREYAAQCSREIISVAEHEQLEQMAGSVHRHEAASKLLSEGRAEGVVRASYASLKCQARIDWLNPIDGMGICDLKTCDSLDRFEADARRYGYLHQLAFYRELVAAATRIEHECHLIAVEKRAPYRCGVWLIERDVLDATAKENEQAMQQYEQSLEDDSWPSGFEQVRRMGAA